MKLLFTSRNVAEIGLLKGLLESENIPCLTRNEYVSLISLSREFTPELYVANDEDFSAAQNLLAISQQQSETKFENWICPQCGEMNEAQFGACWKCDTSVDA